MIQGHFQGQLQGQKVNLKVKFVKKCFLVNKSRNKSVLTGEYVQFDHRHREGMDCQLA